MPTIPAIAKAIEKLIIISLFVEDDWLFVEGTESNTHTSFSRIVPGPHSLLDIVSTTASSTTASSTTDY